MMVSTLMMTILIMSRMARMRMNQRDQDVATDNYSVLQNWADSRNFFNILSSMLGWCEGVTGVSVSEHHPPLPLSQDTNTGPTAAPDFTSRPKVNKRSKIIHFERIHTEKFGVPANCLRVHWLLSGSCQETLS